MRDLSCEIFVYNQSDTGPIESIETCRKALQEVLGVAVNTHGSFDIDYVHFDLKRNKRASMFPPQEGDIMNYPISLWIEAEGTKITEHAFIVAVAKVAFVLISLGAKCVFASDFEDEINDALNGDLSFK